MITIVRAVQTCTACPSQWDAWDADGNYYYLRYRHGHGEVTQFRDEDWWKAKDWGGYSDNPGFIGQVAQFSHGDPLDGLIELDEFARLAGMLLELQEERQ